MRLLAATRENVGGDSGFAAKRCVVRAAAALLGGADVEREVAGYERAARKSAIDVAGEATFAATGNMGRNWHAPAGLFGGSMQARFEGLTLPIPAGYDALLRTIYGDYMQLPPEEQRMPHHAFELWVLEAGEERARVRGVAEGIEAE